LFKTHDLCLLVTTCAANSHKANAQRATWVPTALHRFDVVFVRGGSNPLPDELVIEVDDGYDGLPAKVRAAMQWAFHSGYEFVFKLDDDVLIRPDKLYALPFRDFDYYGLPAPDGRRSGFCYSLSRRAMQLVASADLNATTQEDAWVNQVLRADPAITVGDADPLDLVLIGRRHRLSYISERTAAICEFTTEASMREAMTWTGKRAWPR
jgi:hypothetical protein